MPVYQIPATARQFEIVRHKDGSVFVVSDTAGIEGVVIPCRDEAQADTVCERLNRDDRPDEIDVPLFGLPAT